MRVFLTGASEGIGGATARRLAKRAADAGTPARIALGASGRKPAPDELIADLEASGADVTYLTGDVSDAPAARDMAEQALSFCGGMDVYVANAGGVAPGRLADTPVDIWDRQFALNTRAPFVQSQALYPALAESRGAIVAVASMSGLGAHVGQAAYGPAKAALISMVRVMAQEWAADGIRVNAVAPGLIQTPLTEATYADPDLLAAREAFVPMHRIGQPQDIAAVVDFLASPDAAYVTGQVLLADGGLLDSTLGRVPPRKS